VEDKMKNIKAKVNKYLSLTIAKKPEKVLLIGIIILNFILVFGAAALLVLLFPELAGGNFWKTAYNVFTMILDAGCISDIVTGRYENNALLSLLCIAVIFIGTLIFTGAIIGYLSNRISNFINEANKGNRRLFIADHIVIVNWNNRAAEIINDLLYSEKREKVVVLVSKNKDQVELEIKNLVSDTIEREKRRLSQKADLLIEQSLLKKSEKKKYIKDKYSIKKTDIIVREGEVYSLKQLNDISVSTAKNIIILSKNQEFDICKYQNKEMLNEFEKGNIETVKSLVQISQITSAEESADNQKVVVEVEDDWTMSLVNKIIKHKEKKGKCNIIPVPVNKILGQILSQFSIMPELNSVYSELFSNRGSTFYSKRFGENDNEIEFFTQYLQTHEQALPITTMKTQEGRELFYIASKHENFDTKCSNEPEQINIKLNDDYKFERKHIAILGHNSKCLEILEGFAAFVTEWGNSNQTGLLDIIIIDDEEHLKKVNFYTDFRERFTFIKDVISAEVYDESVIQKTLKEYIESYDEDTSVLILSDDNATGGALDSKALTYLVYLQDIIYEKINQNSEFNPDSIDVIVELLNPKNYDVVKSYSVNNVIISNRYISRMIVQIGEKESIYEFYKDILTYDTDGNSNQYTSKELYIKNVSEFFDKGTVFPIVTTPRNLVASVYNVSPEYNKTIILGMAKNNSTKALFTDSKNKEIVIDEKDKLILFSPH
jgi:hypothetical protein